MGQTLWSNENRALLGGSEGGRERERERERSTQKLFQEIYGIIDIRRILFGWLVDVIVYHRKI